MQTLEVVRPRLAIGRIIGHRKNGEPIYQIEGRAVSAFVYGQAPMKAFNKEIDFDSDALKATLHTSTYTPNQDTQAYVSDLTNEVANGNGYTTGGISLANRIISYTGATNVVMFDCDDLIWTEPTTISARYCVISDRTAGTAATQPLLAYIDFGANKASDGGPFKVTIDPAGLFTATAA